jgi:starch phosphorylase
MKQAIVELAPRFSSNRMVLDYMAQAYAPSFQNNLKLYKDDFASARELSEWRMGILTKWSNLRIKNVQGTSSGMLFVRDNIKVSAQVFMADIAPEHMQVEIYAGKLNQDNSFISRDIVPMRPEGEAHNGWQTFVGEMDAGDTGRYGLSVRAIPRHPLLPNQHFGLTTWASVE